jgi:hypothetical protein
MRAITAQDTRFGSAAMVRIVEAMARIAAPRHAAVARVVAAMTRHLYEGASVRSKSAS